MTCDDIRRRIHEAHDDRVASALDETIPAHLASCSACRSLAEDLESLSFALRELPAIPLPSDALDVVWRQTVRARSSGTLRGAWRLAAAAAFVTVLSAATLYVVLKPSPPSQPSAVEIARASAQAELVLGYTARALEATRVAAADRVLASKISPAVRGVAATHPTRRP